MPLAYDTFYPRGDDEGVTHPHIAKIANEVVNLVETFYYPEIPTEDGDKEMSITLMKQHFHAFCEAAKLHDNPDVDKHLYNEAKILTAQFMHFMLTKCNRRFE